MNLPNKFCYDYPRPAVTVDLVIFTWYEDDLKLLLIERGSDPFQGSWALPGGFIDENETDIYAAKRELFEETNLQVENLTQFYVASEPGRDPRGWIISIVFIGFIGESRIDTLAGDDARNFKWFSINDLPDLAFDHKLIIYNSKKYLINISNLSIIDNELLPEKFNLYEITNLYRQIGNSEIQAEELVNRLIDYRVILKTETDFYRFEMNAYKTLREQGFGISLIND